jgi:putative SOS response-associated peptidase YedK
MCGRFEFKATPEDLEKIFKKDKKKLQFNSDPKAVPKDDIFIPRDSIFTIFHTDGEYKLSLTRWGIQFTPRTPLLFNMQIERIQERPFWKKLFTKYKCLVPMTAFYKLFKDRKKKIRQKIFFPDSELIFVPAIYKLEPDNIYLSLVTTPPNMLMKHLHKRMPVVLNFEEGIEYLHNDYESNLKLCDPYRNELKLETENAKAFG